MLDTATRARQKALQVTDGEAILALLTSTRMRKALVRAAEAGEVPLATAAPEILASFPSAVADLGVRQLIGLAVGLVMAEAGFVALRRCRIPGCAPFRYGTAFARPAPAAAPGLLARLVDSLSPAEAEEAYALLRARLGR